MKELLWRPAALEPVERAFSTRALEVLAVKFPTLKENKEIKVEASDGYSLVEVLTFLGLTRDAETLRLALARSEVIYLYVGFDE
jgi:hypothetical protein